MLLNKICLVLISKTIFFIYFLQSVTISQKIAVGNVNKDFNLGFLGFSHNLIRILLFQGIKTYKKNSRT